MTSQEGGKRAFTQAPSFIYQETSRHLMRAAGVEMEDVDKISVAFLLLETQVDQYTGAKGACLSSLQLVT